MVGKSDFNENPVVSLDLDFDLGFVNTNRNLLHRDDTLTRAQLNQAQAEGKIVYTLGKIISDTRTRVILANHSLPCVSLL